MDVHFLQHRGCQICYFSRGKEEIVLEIFHFSAFERHFLSIYSSSISSKKVCVKEITGNIEPFNKSIVCFHLEYCVQSYSPAIKAVAVETEEVQRLVT